MQSKKQLGLFSALFVAMGATLGTGIVLTYGSILSATGSILISLAGWIIAGLLIIPQMMIQGEMTSAYPHAGGPYAFFKQAKLKPASFMYGWCYAIWGWPFSIAFRAYVTFQFLDFLIQVLTGTKGAFFDPWILRTIAASAIIVFGILNYYSVKISALVNNILTISKIALLLLIIIVAFSAFNSNNFSWAIAQQVLSQGSPAYLWFKGLAFSVALAIWSYNGINTIAYMAPEFKNAQKTLPLVMILGTIIITVIYALFVIALGGLLSASQAINALNNGLGEDQIALLAIKQLHLEWIAITLIFLIFILSLSTVFTFTKIAPRLPYAMAKDGLFFKSFGKLNANNIPGLAIVFNTVFAALLTFIPYNTSFMLIFFTSGTAIMNLFISLVILKCWKNLDYKPLYKIKAPRLILTFSILSCLFVAGSGYYTAFSSISQNWWLIWAPICSLLTMSSAYPVYYGWIWWQKQIQLRKKTAVVSQKSPE